MLFLSKTKVICPVIIITINIAVVNYAFAVPYLICAPSSTVPPSVLGVLNSIRDGIKLDAFGMENLRTLKRVIRRVNIHK